MIKRILSSLLICFFVFSNAGFCQEAIKGRIQFDENTEVPNIFTGDVEEIKKGAKLKMTVSSVISSGLNREGDEFFAEITDDFSTDSGVVLPAGTVAHGVVTRIENKKSMGRDGYINLKFDYLLTPDNRRIPIDASMTTKRNPVAGTAKVILEDTAYTVAGGVVGGLLALKFLGLGTAIASKGATVAGGAGVGAVVGLTASMVRKGKEVLLAPGDEIKVKIVESIDLPVMTEEALKDKELHYDGLNVKIIAYALEKDPFGELNTITIGVDIDNRTKKTFSSFDMALVSEYKSVYYASPFGYTDLWFKKITPNSRVRGRLSFSVDNPKKSHWLVFYDNRTRKPLAKFSIKNAERELKKLSYGK